MANKPGPPRTSSTVPFVKNSRLLDNPNLTRMPVDQRSWNAFILELNKWIKGETYAWDPTFTGFSSDPDDGAAGTAVVQYQIFGEMIILNFDLVGSGNSDAADFTISNLPSDITPRWEQIYPITGLLNAGVTTNGNITIKTDGTLEFSRGDAGGGGGWTIGGVVKGFDARSNCVVYSLHNIAESLPHGGPL